MVINVIFLSSKLPECAWLSIDRLDLIFSQRSTDETRGNCCLETFLKKRERLLKPLRELISIVAVLFEGRISKLTPLSTLSCWPREVVKRTRRVALLQCFGRDAFEEMDEFFEWNLTKQLEVSLGGEDGNEPREQHYVLFSDWSILRSVSPSNCQK